ncbi:anillin-like isoform X2 [Physella acuta]|uniref:anillin-like isoform X2 n=1 Tax=Physella acuta TaxID=109671 RepID=UPI0027DADC76|nr:anillin-like isoform X2 [Physella acuta]
MDPDTQRLIERTRQRREILNQRIAGMPEAAPRKRRTPVLESDGSEKILTEVQNNQDESPKRQCFRDVEQTLKPDTPAIQGVHSRAKDLSHLLTKDNNEENVEVPTPKPRKSISSPPLEKRGLPSPAKAENSSSISSARKGRFAALAQHINNFEDDLTRHVIQKEEEKKPRWQPPAPAKAETLPKASVVSSGKGPAPKAPVATTVASSVAASSSPKKTHAPPTPRNNVPKSPASTLTRNSPLRTSKVELNSSPKPFSPAYKDNVISPVKFSVDLTASAKLATPVKSVIKPAGSNSPARTWNSPPSDLPVNAPGLNETPPESDLNKTMDEPTSKPVSQRMATWAQKTETPKSKVIEPSRQPLSSKLASFEKKITESTPRSGKASSVHVPKTPKQVCTPALSASTPVPTSAVPTKVRDPSELPVSQRMSQMQEKLSNTPLRRQDEPTAFPVGARMSAWETMTAANNVSNVKKVNPADVAPVTPKPRPFSSIVPGSSAAPATPQNPPPPPPVTKSVTPAKSFRECIEEKASIMWSKKGVDMSSSSPAMTGPEKQSPSKMLCRTPSKIIHSPTKVSEGTKSAQKLLVERCQDSITTASAKAAQERASRMAELGVIQNRWKNGILRDDNSSSDESSKVAPVDSKVDSKTPEKPTSEPKTPASSRREEARNKARAEFNSKLAEIGLVSDTSSKKELPATGLPASESKTNTKPTTGGQTSSIYNLIKKREEISSQTVEEKKVKFNDSFDDSDDDSDRKIPRSARKLTSQSSEEKEFKVPEVPKAKEEKESDGATSSDVGDEEFGSRFSLDIDDDDISLKGFVSEAVRRESILPVPAQRSSQSESSGDELGGTGDSEGSVDMPSSSKHGGYQADDDSMDEEDDSQRNAVDELLDEAMSDTSDDYDPDMDPNNVVLRRPRPNNDYDPDMDINNVQMRRKTTDPVPAHRNYNRGTDSTEDEDDNRPYSLQAYRKSANIHQHMMEPIVRSSRYAGKPVEEEEVRMPAVTEPRRDDRRAVQERIKELQELVQQEQNVIMQTSNALNKCCMGNSYFAGSAEQVECNKLLLIACQKRQCYMTEIQRLKETGVLSHEGPGPQGSLTISDIRLPLKKEFVTKIGTSQDTTTHYFILLFKNGSQLICTQMLSTHDPMMRGSLDFPNLIKINGITGNFKLVLDIYSMSVSKEYSKDKKKKTPKKSKGYAMALESPGGPTAVRTTSFSHVTSLTLNMKCLDKNSFHLERLPYLSPLYGQIFMRLKCLMEVNVEERGFLTMFDDVSGFGAWHRRWCVLSGNKLCVWKYPDDETRKDPMAIIDLKRCITEKVGLVPRDICARPNTFEMVTVRQPLKGEHDTLVTKTYNSTTTVRHQISADSKEERIVWCNKINRTLANLRTWNADALKPSKPQATSSYH